MKRVFRRRPSLSAKIGRLTALVAFIVLVIASAMFRFDVLNGLAFLFILTAATGLALVALIFAAIGLWRMWQEGAIAGGNVLATILLCALTLTPFMWGSVQAAKYPLLNDVTTDLGDIPQFPIGAQIGKAPPIAEPLSEDERAELQRKAYRDLEPLAVAASPAATEAMVKVAAASLGWEPGPRSGAITSEDGGNLAFVARTLLLGFRDDVVVRIKPDGSDGSVLDVRSVSRLGDHDLGGNANNIAEFLRAFATEYRKQNG
jgi:uncharacterized protein (DUF1499 family)